MNGAHRSSSTASPNTIYKFPELPSLQSPNQLDEVAISESDYSPAEASFAGLSSPTAGTHLEDRWQARRKWTPTSFGRPSKAERRRQRSLSEAFKVIKDRRGSVTENVHEIAEALKAPVSPALVLLCGLWYLTSIFTNASSKSILIAFRYPVTLTVAQFAFVSGWCVFSSYLAHIFPSLRTSIPALRYPIQKPTRELIITTLPLTAFQIGGHILNSDAMSRIPVSLVHTIKGLSPLFTVLAYRFLYHIHYSTPTYLSLIPLTLGVIMACSANLAGDTRGLLCAFGSALLFVTQNIVSKKLFNDAARAEAEGLAPSTAPKKPDKLNLLCYSSFLALVFTLPLWFWSEGYVLVRDLIYLRTVPLSDRPDALDHGRLSLEFIFNGTFHFAQSLVAFQLLSMVSPVTYSVASLIKRVFVIVFAITWFGNVMTRIQGVGIGLTFLGLYLYDRTNDAARADRRARLAAATENPLLPIIAEGTTPGSTPFRTSPTRTTFNQRASRSPVKSNGYDGSEKGPDSATGSRHQD